MIEINRIGSDRKVCQSVDRIGFSVNGIDYLISAEFGELKVHAKHHKLVIKPCCANEVTISGVE
jgi:hypothetical protein